MMSMYLKLLINLIHLLYNKYYPVALKKKDLDKAIGLLDGLWRKGYSAIDIVTLSFKVAKYLPDVSEQKRLDMIKEIGFVHMRVLEGVATYLQLCGMYAKICDL